MKPASLRIVLVRPRDPNNIGAAARAMANFGLDDLRVVAPHPPVWREAKSAVGAEGLLRDATEASSIEEAVAGCGAVWATSSMKRRKPETPVCDLPSVRWPPETTAVLFGQEKTGLTAEDLAYASSIVRVPTWSAQPSMNLAAAVAVVAYEFGRERARARAEPAGEIGAAMKGRVWDAVLAVAQSVGWPEGARTRRLKAAVYRSRLSECEAGLALELARRLLRQDRFKAVPGRS